MVRARPFAAAPLLAFALAAAAPACANGPAAKPDAGPAAKLGPCTTEGLPPEARCGTYEVWEDRAAESGRKIPVRVVLLPATGKNPAPDPVLYLAGGPGDAATNAAAGFARFLPLIRQRRALLFIDQRGSLGANPLLCSLGGTDADLQSYIGEQFPLAEVRRCRQELEKKADLRLYTTDRAIDDFDEVRAWLGYDKVNLFGGSYGTRAAQVYLRRHPQSVRSVILLGVAPIDETLPISHSQAAQRALDLLLDRCAADAGCGKAFPDLRAEFQQVLARLDRGPVPAEVRHPETGKETTVQLGRGAFVEAVRWQMYKVETARALPLQIHQAARGDFGPLAQDALDARRAIPRFLALGMLLSVTCAEDLPFLDPATIAERTRGSYLGDERVRTQLNACGEWPRGAVPAGHMDLVRTDLPVLMLFGEIDPVTPPEFAARVAAGMPNSLQVVVPGGAHGNFDPCLERLMHELLERASVRGLDTSCVAKIQHPPFLTEPAREEAARPGG
ncbi:MAG TPA: alpha/beta fold hydrolase [Thermoanaerobaculia bacterium]|nr:alpha/beta fold hydrolase [Thermoanaerobaculia bacterium]